MQTRFMRAWILSGLVAFFAALPLAPPASAWEAPSAGEGVTIFLLAPAMHAISMTKGPDGNMWFTGASSKMEGNEARIGRIAPNGEVTEFNLPGSGYSNYALGMVAGPDGNLWFAQPGVNRIGRITTSGAITQFQLPTPDSQPNDVAVGADGNLWFAEAGASKIGRITTGGEITEFALSPGRAPAGIAPGPDGSLWFTEQAVNQIGRITTTGEVAEFPIPGRDSRPSAIALGPDDNLWFTEHNTNKIGRIAPDGTIVQFPVPAIGADAIAAGPDGNLWFTNYLTVGSISPSGLPVQQLCLSASCRLPPLSIAAGDEGNLWLGTSIEYPSGGGGMTAILTAQYQPGYIAKFSPATPRVEIGPRARPLSGRATDLRVTCEAATACRGAIRLTRQVSAYPKNFVYAPPKFVGGHRYELAPGESRRIRLRLTGSFAEKLRDRGLLAMWALAGTRTHAEAIQSVLLRSVTRGKRRQRKDQKSAILRSFS